MDMQINKFTDMKDFLETIASNCLDHKLSSKFTYCEAPKLKAN